MLNIFALSPNDQSIYYLGQVFGLVGDVIPVQSVGSPNLLFGIMFKVFNTVALTVGAIIITYTTIIGLMATAHEGEFLGKKWGGAGAIWLPIRMVVGTAMVFPTSSGYSAAQIIIMWIIVQGIGAADTLWTAVLNYVKNTGGIFSTVSMPTSDVKTKMESLFKVLVCQESARAQYAQIEGSGHYYTWFCNGSSNTFCTQSDIDTYNVIDGPQDNYLDPTDKTQKLDIITYHVGPSSACGYVEYNNPDSTMKSPVCAPQDPDTGNKDWGPDSLLCLSYKGQQAALQSIVPILSAIAQEYAMVDNQYVSWYETVVTQPGAITATGVPSNGQNITPEPPDWIKSYCTSVGISDPNACCVYPNKDSDQGCVAGQSCCAGPDAFASDISNAGASDTSDQAVQQAYFPFAINTYLGPNLDFIDSATNQFIQQAMTGPYQNYISTLGPAGLAGSSYQGMSNDGWLTAGSYYWDLMKTGQGAVSAISPTINVVPTSPPNFGGPSDKPYRSSMNAADTLINVIEGGGGAIANSGLGAVMARGNKVTSSTNDIVKGFISMISSKSDKEPIVSIASFGMTMISTAKGLFFAMVGTGVALTAIAAFSNWINLGFGWTVNPAYEAVKAGVGFFAPFVAALIIGIFSLGVMLGLYLPMIPFLIYTITAIGWFIAVVIAMVAGPLVALGILSPGGQSELLGHADKSVMILFDLFLRPTLMVFGLIAAMLLSSEVLRMFNSGYAHLVAGILGSQLGLVEQIILISVYTALLVTIVSKVFSLIHMIPERALTYIGGAAMAYGEAEALGAAKQAAEGAGGAVSGAGKSGGGAAIGGAETAGKAKAQKEGDQQKADKAELEARQKKEEEAKKGKEGGGQAQPPNPDQFG